MPKGVPVATVAIGNAANAGLLAVRWLRRRCAGRANRGWGNLMLAGWATCFFDMLASPGPM